MACDIQKNKYYSLGLLFSTTLFSSILFSLLSRRLSRFRSSFLSRFLSIRKITAPTTIGSSGVMIGCRTEGDRWLVGVGMQTKRQSLSSRRGLIDNVYPSRSKG